SGGIQLDAAFTPQLLYELAKMDGAIIVNSAIAKIAQANVQLMPDPTIPSNETGTRHRTAERVARQTGALVISISQQRETVTVFVGESRYQLDPIADVLAKTNQALATLETYRQRLDQVLTRLTALEFQNAVMLDDVLVVLQRAELTTRMADYIERACTELGSEGRLIRMQLEEQVGEVPAEKAAIVYDYHADGGAERVAEGLEALAQLPYQELLEFELLAMLGYPATTNPLDYAVTPRGYRVLTHIPRLPENVIHRLVTELAGLEGIVRASQRDLEAVDGVGAVRAREIREGLRRLQEHNRDKMKTGDIFELAEVVRNLSLRDHEKGLSTGEKQMFVKAKKILASELMYAKDMDEDEAAEWLDSVLANGGPKKKTTKVAATA